MSGLSAAVRDAIDAIEAGPQGPSVGALVLAHQRACHTVAVGVRAFAREHAVDPAQS